MRLTALHCTPKGAARRSAKMRGKMRIKKNFDQPLPKEMLASFEGKSFVKPLRKS